MRIRSFQGLRPAPSSVAQVVSLPYDVVNTEEARALAHGNPLSFLHVVRAEIDFPEGTDPYTDPVYAKAVANFKALQQEGHLIRESEPAVYIYQQQWGTHVQQGVVALCHVEDYERDLIKKHEKTRVAKENDRTRLTGEMSANSGPVFLAYKDQAAITALMQEASAGDPLYQVTTDDGITHSVWKVSGGEAFVEAFESVPCFYVADGHHRSASAARVGRERREANPNHTGEEDYNWFLNVIFPGSQLKILPYNRIVYDLNGLDTEAFLGQLAAVTSLERSDNESPSAPGEVCVYVDGVWYTIRLVPEPDADPVGRLDVSMLQDRILGPILGIDDPRTSERIEFAGGIRGTQYLKDSVDSGRGAVAFSVYPVQIEQLMDIADAGQIMAPKSTWFEPKLRSGFLIHTF